MKIQGLLFLAQKDIPSEQKEVGKKLNGQLNVSVNLISTAILGRYKESLNATKTLLAKGQDC